MNTIFVKGIGLVNLVNKLQKVYRTYHLRSRDLLNSHFVNLELFPAIQIGIKKGFRYKFELVESKWSF